MPIDALTGSVLAAKLNAPLLLTPPEQLQASTWKELQRVNPNHYSSVNKPYKIYLLGGKAAISKNIESKLKNKYGSSNIIRITGATRY
ncbi:cell wall-binding repeat-containing protein [Sediminibacillus albus]|uniref:cell wall-binding repeat-containing protein n=1 Tax=Sediminibacillus albus TaxID=407036 RepID=UPI000B889750|nr:cell wall-binding repeat-containing protein [Sediminibacillus albus]